MTKIDYFRMTEELLTKLPHQLQVQYALNCANSVAHLDPSKEGQIARSLIQDWLNGKPVSNQEMRDAYSNAAATAANDAAYAIASAAYAANAAAYAAYDAAYAYAANAAANAANAAAYAEGKTMEDYYNELVVLTDSLTKMERLIYNLDVA